MNRPVVRRALPIALALTVVLAVPAVAAAHAELDTASPADGETVTGTPAVIEATYTETLDPDGSSLVLVDAAGTEIATGGVTTTDATKSMSITDLPELPPGDYTVQSTTTSADDGDVDRTTWSFTVVAAPTTEPSPAPTDQPSPTSSPLTASPIPTAATASPSAASPIPSGDAGDQAGGTTDALFAIIAALAIVAIAAVILVRRRGRSTPSA